MRRVIRSLLKTAFLLVLFANIASAASGLFIVVVNSDLQPYIQGSLDQYKKDLETEGYTAEIKSWTLPGSTAEDLKTYLAGRMGDGLVGTLFVGTYQARMHTGIRSPGPAISGSRILPLPLLTAIMTV